MKVAAYQAPLRPAGAMDVMADLQKRVRSCEANGTKLLCFPEAVLGGLADDLTSPTDIAIDSNGGELEVILAPLASRSVTTLVGFTEIAPSGDLFNTAAVFHQGAVVGLYRKQYPAVRRSCYQAGGRTPVFTVGGLTFGILICNDSNYPELAQAIASQGATVLFIPTNNGLPLDRADVVDEARRVDVSLARQNGLAVVRADVAGRTGDRVAHGSSEIVAADGTILCVARSLVEDLILAEIEADGC